MRVAFFDRDGIINKERGDYTWLKEQFEFTQGLFPFLKELRRLEYQIIIITNQGGIEKGLYSKAEVEKLHHWMIDTLKKEGIEILDVFYCPHHSDFQKCLCRKPSSLLIEKALAVHKVDASGSFMFGDRQRDVDAAEGAGVRGILMDSNPDWSQFPLSRILK